MSKTFPTVAPPETTGPQYTALPSTGPVEETAGADVRGGTHVMGLCSIETFCNQGALSLTHDDADGFRLWLQSYGNTANFHFKDAAVKAWEYGETYDNWQDTYGMDADLAFYHSGHGGMDGNGIFYVPMGAAWAGNDCTVTSNNMRVGNEYCRYLFWSTCLSLRVFDGHSPLRTWGNVARGLRMIFGFETVSYDNANYGRYFGQRWNAGDSFSSAWLNASWAIAHNQAPTVAAFGANAAEASDRVFNERFFNWATVDSSYMWWRWYAAATAARELNRDIPDDLLVAVLAPVAARSAANTAENFGFHASDVETDGPVARVVDGRRSLHISPEGLVVAQLAQANRENREALTATEAQTAAVEAMRTHGLDVEGPMVLDSVAGVHDAGASHRNPTKIDGPHQTETMVQYRQTIGGIPVITPGVGTIQVTVDNDGKATSISATTRKVDDLTSFSPNVALEEPTPPGREATASEEPDVNRLLARSLSDRLRSMSHRGDLPAGINVVPGTTEIGYDIQGDHAVLVAQRSVELDFGGLFKKRYLIKAPLNG